MPSESAFTALSDIAYHIDLANHFIEGFEFAAFCDDLRTVYAVTRCLEIISEASRRLPEDMKARHPSIAWKNIAGAGNVYRHDYEDVEATQVWEAVRLALPPLCWALAPITDSGTFDRCRQTCLRSISVETRTGASQRLTSRRAALMLSISCGLVENGRN